MTNEKTNTFFYMQTQSISMLVHCGDNKRCVECETRCEKYEQNQNDFWKWIMNREHERREKKMKTLEIHITPGITPTETENEKLVELAELQSTADELGQFIIESMEDKELKKLNKDMEKIKEKISKRQLEIGLANAEIDRNEVLAQLANKMTELGKEITDDRWGPNQFTKGKKLEFSNGEVSLLRSTTTRRKINVKKLLDINPIKVSEFAEKGKLGLTISDAGETMSENEINEVSDKTISHTYELYVKGRRYE